MGWAVSTAASFATEEAASPVTAISSEEVATMPSNEDLLKRIEALESQAASTPKSGWEGKVRVKGDLRYRFQHVEAEDTSGNDLSTTKNIQRIRARLGVYADVNDWITAGLGMRTGNGSANSGNVTLGEGFSGKDFSLSLAYFTLSPEEGNYGAATFGKMHQPWKSTTDLIWDSDVNPEGVAYTYDRKLENTEFIASAGHYIIVDTTATAHDATMNEGQLAVAQNLGKTKLTLGGSFYGYENVTDVAAYAVDYDIAECIAELAVKDVGPVPFKLYGSYVNNTSEEDQNEGYCVGIKFGDAKKGKWEAKYDYRDLELYAAPPAFTDSDFADGGTGVTGHRIKADYNFAKNFAGGLTYIYSMRTPERTLDQDQQFNTLMLDLMVKF